MQVMAAFPATDLDQTLVDALPPTYNERRVALLNLARFAETSERFEDMCKIMKAVVQLDDFAIRTKIPEAVTLSVEERNLLSVGYKNVISSRRASWRTLQAAADEEGRASGYIKVYIKQLEEELCVISHEILSLLIDNLIPAYYQSTNLPKDYGVFFLKMAGDYYRYLAEFMDPTSGYHENARNYYQKALDLADSGSSDPNDPNAKVPTTHPIRLGLALNFSVCYFEILNQTEQAVALAKKTFDDALEDLDYLSEQAYKDSTMILQLLKDNLNLWM